jgi:hypothetical protein
VAVLSGDRRKRESGEVVTRDTLQSTAEEGYAEYIWEAIDERLDQ